MYNLGQNCWDTKPFSPKIVFTMCQLCIEEEGGPGNGTIVSLGFKRLCHCVVFFLRRLDTVFHFPDAIYLD